MIKRTLVLLFFVAPLIGLFAQINFEKGYFIDNNGAKQECFIKNLDWRYNPLSFKYRYSKDSEIRTASLDNVKAFQINGAPLYERFTVQMNRSEDKIERLDTDQRIDFDTETLFLKVLVDGSARLLYYEESGLQRFFSSVNNSNPVQLVYKRYLLSNSSKKKYSNTQTGIAEVNTFRQQLLNTLDCGKISENRIKKLRYKLDDLIDLFEDFNQCVNPDYTVKEANRLQFDIKGSLRPGMNSSSLSVANSLQTGKDVDFGNETSFRFGFEVEAVLPFNKNKWSVFLEPTYQSYSSEGETAPARFSTTTRPARTSYSSLDFPIGFRHYMFLTDRFKLFANAAYTISFPLNSELAFENPSTSEPEFASSSNINFGLGFKWNDKFGLEARYRAARELYGNDEFVSITSDYSGFSIIFGYTIF